MRRKIFWNCLMVGILIMVLCSILFCGVFIRRYEIQAYSQLAAETNYIVHGIELSGTSYLDTLDTQERVTWVDADGTVLYDSHADQTTMVNHLGREEIREALEQGVGWSSRFSETVLERHLYYARRIADGTVLRVSCTQGTVVAMALMLFWPMLGIMAAVLLLCVLLAFRLSRHIVRPINQIDPDHPVLDESYQELAPLVTRLQEQNRTIRRQMEELSRRQREFAAITENMSEGFLLVDNRCNVLSGNSSALRLLAGAAGQRVENLRRDGCVPQVLDAVLAALAGSRSDLLLEINERTWRILVNQVVSNGQIHGVVVLVVDVTEREQREQLRREFSANVSHELKTPLTSISGFAELMKEGMVPAEVMRDFAGDIYRESQRLIALVNDIIRLSKLDENTQLFEAETVDLYALGEKVISELRPIAENRSVSLVLFGSPVSVCGVRQILEEMVYNLCDNAIKYNRPGGSVTVCVEERAGRPCLTVSDTGIGIPQGEQARVFERFYRVDKSHSKEVGGTGLGLSIVKHGAQYHGAQLKLESEPGKGTAITILF